MAKGKQPNPNVSVRGIGELAPDVSLSGTGRNNPVPEATTNKSLRSRNQTSMNMSFTMEIMKISESAKVAQTVDELRCAFKEYLLLCEKYSIPPNNMAAYAALGIDLNTAKMWTAGKAGRDKAELIHWVNQFVGMNRETGIVTGAISPSVGMFLQKNFDGLSDQPTQVAEETDLLGDKPSAEDIIDRYSDLPDED